MNNKLQIANLIEQILGKGRNLKQDEMAFFCPFCSHHKRKLQVNLKSYLWHCWVCDNKGRSLYSLFKRLNATQQQFKALSDLLGTRRKREEKEDVEPVLYLPSEFTSLAYDTKTNLPSKDPDFVNAVNYLVQRGVNNFDIMKHNVGYCSEGQYSGMVIVPSYDYRGRLNYFVGRSFYESKMKYRNPPVSRDIIGFDLHINWNEPIVLVEGVFDAIAVKRNAIPLFGKFMSQTLIQRIVERRVPWVLVALDADASESVVKMAEILLAKDVNVGFVEMEDREDPADLGFEEMTYRLKHITEANFSTLMRLKLKQGTSWKKREYM